MKFGSDYFGYCTDFAADGKVFGVIHSRDLVNWEYLGGAMRPIEGEHPMYWAPEVSYADGTFYLYYSVGNETLMQIRVAVSDRPDGGFEDSGHVLTREDFAIDAHVFRDDDGQLYLFYATDFLEHTHIGTGTVVDRMIDRFTLEGRPRPVTRARFDWQVYDPQRKEKGGVRWHTVEGPTVLKRKGRYYEMFSGGNWQNTTYGVSYAVTDDIDRGDEWEQHADGQNVLPILRTIPGVIVGPGHNSVVRGPNNRELYCVYHRWTEAGRVLAIDRMDFNGEGLFVAGPTSDEQPAPFRPAIDGIRRDEGWTIDGEWELSDRGHAVSTTDEAAELRMDVPESFLCEFMFRQVTSGDAGPGFALRSAAAQLDVSFTGGRCRVARGGTFADVTLADEFDPTAFHIVRVEVDHLWCRVAVDEAKVFEGRLAEVPNELVLLSGPGRAEFAGFALTRDSQNDLDRDISLEDCGWTIDGGQDSCRLVKNELILTSPAAIVRRETYERRIELAANIRVDAPGGAGERQFGFALLGVDGTRLLDVRVGNSREIQVEHAAGTERFAMPEAWSAESFHQYRVLVLGDEAYVRLDGEPLGKVLVGAMPALRPAVFVGGSTAIAIDMLRVTAV